MERLSVIIIDDEIEAQDILENLLNKYPDITVAHKASSVDEAIVKILETKPDLIFLDIEMPRKNGFELLKLLKSTGISIPVIFVTAFDQYAIEAIKASAFDYLLKPVEVDELDKAIKRFRTEKKENLDEKIDTLLNEIVVSKKLRFNTRDGFILIDPKEIAYCLADGNYTEIFMRNTKKSIVTSKLKEVGALLSDYNQFLRVSRSSIINLRYLTKVNRKTKKCILSCNDQIIEVDISLKKVKEIEGLVKFIQ